MDEMIGAVAIAVDGCSAGFGQIEAAPRPDA